MAFRAALARYEVLNAAHPVLVRGGAGVTLFCIGDYVAQRLQHETAAANTAAAAAAAAVQERAAACAAHTDQDPLLAWLAGAAVSGMAAAHLANLGSSNDWHS